MEKISFENLCHIGNYCLQGKCSPFTQNGVHLFYAMLSCADPEGAGGQDPREKSQNYRVS